jgi:hypothetical protein
MDRLTFGGGTRGTSAYQPDPNNPNQVQGDSRVFKVGRTTGYTEGVVTALLAPRSSTTTAARRSSRGSW